MKSYVNGIRVFDHMQVDAFARCWNYYFFKFVAGLSEPVFPEALVFGIMFHSGLAAWYTKGSIDAAKKAFMEEAEKWNYENEVAAFQSKSSVRTIPNGLLRLETYCHHYRDDYFSANQVELEHLVKMKSSLPICHGRGIKGNLITIEEEPCYYIVHVDAVGTAQKTVSFLEHKTTSLYAGNTSLNCYTYGVQVKGYSMAVQDKLKLENPPEGYVDFIFLRGKDLSQITARFPLMFDTEQLLSFKKALSNEIGRIIWYEENLDYFTVPTPHRCSAYNRECEYFHACQLLPDIHRAYTMLKNMGFKETNSSRFEHTEATTIRQTF